MYTLDIPEYIGYGYACWEGCAHGSMGGYPGIVSFTGPGVYAGGGASCGMRFVALEYDLAPAFGS